MKKNFFTLLLFLTIFFSMVISCSKDTSIESEPISIATSNFNYVNDTSYMSKVVFINTSINGKKYNWDFGDGQTSILLSPIHYYYDDGNYKVTLTVYDSLNVPNIKTINVIVKSNKAKVVFFEWYYNYSISQTTPYSVKSFQYGKDTVLGNGMGGGTINGFYAGREQPDCSDNTPGYRFVSIQNLGDYYFVAAGESKTTSGVKKIWTGKYTVYQGVCNKVNVAYRK